jgi:hypothetical protein
MLTLSLVVTAILYIFIGYLSYVTASILYRSITYRLIVPTVMSVLFIGTSYISIITDVVLYSRDLYCSIALKNGLLLVLVVLSILSASSRKEKNNEQH